MKGNRHQLDVTVVSVFSNKIRTVSHYYSDVSTEVIKLTIPGRTSGTQIFLHVAVCTQLLMMVFGRYCLFYLNLFFQFLLSFCFVGVFFFCFFVGVSFLFIYFCIAVLKDDYIDCLIIWLDLSYFVLVISWRTGSKSSVSWNNWCEIRCWAI